MLFVLFIRPWCSKHVVVPPWRPIRYSVIIRTFHLCVRLHPLIESRNRASSLMRITILFGISFLLFTGDTCRWHVSNRTSANWSPIFGASIWFELTCFPNSASLLNHCGILSIVVLDLGYGVVFVFVGFKCTGYVLYQRPIYQCTVFCCIYLWFSHFCWKDCLPSLIFMMRTRQ